MALQASGQITLDDIHVEAGGTTLSACTINDTDIRDLISKSSGVQMTFSEWYGASSSAAIVWAATNVNAFTFSPGTATASHTFETDGGCHKNTNGGGNVATQDWSDDDGGTTGSDYAIRTGTVSQTGTGTFNLLGSNTVYNLGTARVNSVADSGGQVTATIPIHVRLAADSTTTPQYNLYLDAEVA